MIYVNGATGMIGRNLLKEMSDIKPFSTKLVSKDSIKDATAIVHLDAYGANDNSYNHIDSINSLRQVIEAMPPYCKLIYISTCTLYKSSKYIVDEESELDPSTMYLKSKLFCEDYIKSNVLNYTILRLSNVVSNDMKHGVLFDWQSKYRQNESINIYGGYPGSTRSYVSIKAVCKAINTVTSGSIANCETINICGMDSSTLTDIADIMNLNVNCYIKSAPITHISPSNKKMVSMLKFYTCTSSISISDYLHNKGYYERT